MSGSYERAGTVGFRCVADAEDNCGTNGNLCAAETDSPSTEKFTATTPSDWVVFGSVVKGQPCNGELSPVRCVVTKAGKSSLMSDFKSLGAAKPAPVEAATVISYTGGEVHGSTAPVSGRSSHAAGLLGADGGFSFTAPAPLAGKKSTLRIYAGGLLRAQGSLVATVKQSIQNLPAGQVEVGDGGRLSTTGVHVTSNASVVSLRYSGGPLSVAYTAAEGTVCSSSKFCVLPVVDTSTMMPAQYVPERSPLKLDIQGHLSQTVCD